MFDDLNKQDLAGDDTGQNPSAPAPAAPVPSAPNAFGDSGQIAAAKKELDDIFSDSEASAKPAAFAPKQTAESYVLPPQQNHLKGAMVLIALIIGVVGLIGGGIWAYYRFIGSIDWPFLDSDSQEAVIPDEVIETEEIEIKTEEPRPVEASLPEDTAADAGIPEETTAVLEAEIPEEIVSATDTDKDGLTDQEEIQLGTDINSVDSDKDGLFDREEIRIYQTDPLLSDSDGDGYADGAEVSGGYNPQGPGRLYEIK